MRLILLFFGLLIIISTGSSQQHSWTRVIDSDGWNDILGMDLDSKGRICLTGVFGPNALDTTNTFVGVVKYDSLGNRLTTQYLSDAERSYELIQSATAVMDANDNIYISATTNGDTLFFGDSAYAPVMLGGSCLLASVDSAGHVNWVIRGQNISPCFHAGGSQGLAIDVSLKGSLYYSVRATNEFKFNNVTISPNCTEKKYLIKLNADGTVKWFRQGGDHVALDTAENYYLSDNDMLNKFRDDGSVLWTKKFNNKIVAIEPGASQELLAMTLDSLYTLEMGSGQFIYQVEAPKQDPYEPWQLASNSGLILASGREYTNQSDDIWIDSRLYHPDLTSEMLFRWGIMKDSEGEIILRDIQLGSKGIVMMACEGVADPNATFLFGNDYFKKSKTKAFISRITISEWLSPIGISENAENEKPIMVWPNPFKSSVQIDAHMLFPDGYNVRLYDLNGHLILNPTPVIGSYSFDCSKLNAGMYFFEFENGTMAVRKKVLKLPE